MPTYEYKCLKCGHKFEMFQPMSADPVSTCSKCGGAVKRLIGKGLAPIFKGSGFYQTDYKPSGIPNNGGNGKSGSATEPVKKTEPKENKTSDKKTT